MAACNENGVYAHDQKLSSPRAVSGWRGCNTADIKLADLGTHWIWAIDFQMMTGNCAGSGSPLSDIEQRRAASREGAIEAASNELRRRLSDRDCVDARAVMRWLDEIRPAQMDLFGSLAA